MATSLQKATLVEVLRAEPAALAVGQFAASPAVSMVTRLASRPAVRAISFCRGGDEATQSLHGDALRGQDVASGILVVVETDELTDTEVIANLPTALAAELRWLNFRLGCPSRWRPTLGGQTLRQLVSLRVSIVQGGQAALVSSILKSTASLRDLEVVGDHALDVSGCCDIVKSIGPTVRRLRIWNHRASPHMFRVDRSMTVAAFLARTRPDLARTAVVHCSSGIEHPMVYLITEAAEYPILRDAGGTCTVGTCTCQSLSRTEVFERYCIPI